jgi:hypothetical protein
VLGVSVPFDVVNVTCWLGSPDPAADVTVAMTSASPPWTGRLVLLAEIATD